jgi:hypothetical protein
MRGFLGIGAAALGLLGTLVFAAAIGLGWWVAGRASDRADLLASRLDRGLSEADQLLEQAEGRLAALRGELAESRGEAEKLAAENPELPQVRRAIERVLDRLLPLVDRAAALADSLRTVAAALRTAEGVVAELSGEGDQRGRARAAAEAIDRAADILVVPRTRVDAIKSAAAVRATRELRELARDAATGSERLAEALSGARGVIGSARERVGEWRTHVVHWVRVTAVANTLACLWIGLGQLCLIGWGRRLMAGPGQKPDAAAPGQPP